MKKHSVKLNPYEGAAHIATALRSSSLFASVNLQLMAVSYALVEALVKLKLDGSTDLATRNRWRCDGMSTEESATAYEVAMQAICNAASKPDIKAAGELAVICLQAIKRGHLIERDRVSIPMFLQAIGFMSDMQSNTGKNKRPGRRSIFEAPITKALQTIGREATTREIEQWLRGKDIGYNMEKKGEYISYFPDNVSEKQTIKITSFNNVVSQVRKNLFKIACK